MNNLHISMAEFRHASRIIKETETINSLGLFGKVYIAALHSTDKPNQEFLNESIQLNRFNLKSKKLNKKIFSQLFKYIELYRVLFNFYKNENIKVINIHHLALLPIGFQLKRKLGAKLIYDAHELETESNTLSNSKLRKTLAKLIERIFIYKVDEIIVVSDSIAKFYKEKYNIKKPTVILNTPKFNSPPKKDFFREKFDIPNDVKIFLYQGALEKGRGIDLILNTFKVTKTKSVVVFMGYGSLKNKIIDFSYENKNIFFHEAVPPSNVLEYTISADFGLSLIENTCLSYYYCLPNKLFEYCMVGVPVLVSNMIEMKTTVNKNNLGFVINDMNIESLEKTIDKAFHSDYDLISNNCKSFSKNFSWEKQELTIKTLYKNIFSTIK